MEQTGAQQKESREAETRPAAPPTEAYCSNETLDDCSSALQLQLQPKLPNEASPTAHIHCVASTEWSDERMQSQTGSVDCAVEVQVVVQQTPVKGQSEAAAAAAGAEAPPKRKRRKLRCCIITLLVLGLLATGVLVPIAATVGFKQEIAPEYHVLQPPQPSHRLMFAFERAVMASTAAAVFPTHLSDRVTSWTALPSSGVHVAVFNDAPAMQQALAHLAAAGRPQATTRRLSSSDGSSDSTLILKYAISDFTLVADRQVTQVVDPMQLFNLAKQQTRQLLQEQQRHQQQEQGRHQSGSTADSEEDEDVYLWRHQQRQHQSTPAAASAPAAKADASKHDPPQPSSRKLAVAQQVPAAVPSHHLHESQAQSADAAGAAGVPASELLSVVELDGPAGTFMPLPSSTVLAPASAVGHVQALGLARNSGLEAVVLEAPDSQGWRPLPGRSLLQDVSRAVPAQPRSQLQVQQRQAQQQVQRGGSKVAWHLSDGALRIREAWNTTSGLDRVTVAVIDSGVELSSGAVGASLWANAAEVAGDGLDNDGNGYVDDTAGWDFGGACGDLACTFCTPGPDPTDAVGWGTHAASAIAAQPEVAAGSAGIAPGVRVMPLKVADCRHGTQLWDVATQQGKLSTPTADDTSSSSSSSSMERNNSARSSPPAVQPAQGQFGPVLLGSAAVQALDYALLNGAHIVLAGWTAGPLLQSSSGGSGQCLLGPEAAARERTDVAVASGGSGCVDAVQRLLFLDVLKPLQQAGVLVITSDSSSWGASAGAGAGAASERSSWPCSLSCKLDNLLCVAASATLLPPVDSKGGLVDVASAAEFFAPLISQHSSSYYSWVNSGDGSDDAAGSSSSSSLQDDYGGSSTSSTSSADNNGSGAQSGPEDEQDSRAAAGLNDIAKLSAVSCDALRRQGNNGGSRAAAQLRAPGTDVLAGWSWGSHAVVSGDSVAASVAAGVAALAWSKLGQTLGADASPGAFEGLGQQVKQQLLLGSSVSGRTSSAPLGVDNAAAVGVARSSDIKSSSSSAGSSALLELDVFGTLEHSSKPLGEVALQPALLSASITSAARALRYTWHIQGDGSGPYDTNSMWYVARRAMKLPVFPLTHWEFFGATSLVEVAGYIQVDTAGVHQLAASSEDRFVLWLQDWWLHMQAEADPGSLGLTPDAWTARVNFTQPGLYRLRLIIYSPSKPFNLQWKTPGSSAFDSITSFLSLGQAQPLPQHLLQSMLLPLADMADGSSQQHQVIRSAELASMAPNPTTAAVRTKPESSIRPGGSSSGSGSANGTYVASSSSTSSKAQPAKNSAPVTLPKPSGSSPGAASSSSDAGTVTATGSPPAAPAPDNIQSPDRVDDVTSGSASLEPSEGLSDGVELTLAEDAAADDSSGSGGGGGGGGGDSGSSSSSFYNPDSGYQFRPDAAGSDLVGGSTYGSNGGGGDFDGFLSSLRNFFGGGWVGRRRSSHRRALLDTSAAATAAAAVAAASAPSSIGDTGSSYTTGVHEASAAAAAGGGGVGDGQQWVNLGGQQLPHHRHLTAAGNPAAPSSTPAATAVTSSSGRFSLAMTLVERTPYRTLMPDLTTLVFTHTGTLPGPGLNVAGRLQLQQQVLGLQDPRDARGGYGMVQGWLNWNDLNPAATAAQMHNTAAISPGNADRSTGSSSTRGVATEGAGLASEIGGVAIGAAGVQFEVNCDACSLQIDGMTVAGSLGAAETSSCITPAALSSSAAAAGAGSSSILRQQQQQWQQLVHLQMLFTTNDARNTRLSVRARPCSGLSSQAGSGAWSALTAAAHNARPPSFSVPSAAVTQGAQPSSKSNRFARGMLCSVQAELSPTAAAAAAAAATNASSVAFSQLVFVSAEQMQQAITITINASLEDAASSSMRIAAANAQSSSSSTTTNSTHGVTVDAPAGGNGEGDGTGEAAAGGYDLLDTNGTSSSNTSAVNATKEQEDAEAAALQVQLRVRAAQNAAAKAASLAHGISVADLAPDWAASLPEDTQFSLSCGCYWNGSWAGNVSVQVSSSSEAGGAGGSSGHARLFLAGWPVAAKSHRIYGASDLDVRSYSTVMQRQQLAVGSDSADPLIDAAHLWAAAAPTATVTGIISSSSSMDGRGVRFGTTAQSPAIDGSATAASSSSSSKNVRWAAVLSQEDVRRLRDSRLQQLAASRSSSTSAAGGGSGGGGGGGGSSSSSVLLGMVPMGSVDGVSRRAIMPKGGQHQLLVLQGHGLSADSQVVVLAPGDISSSSEAAALVDTRSSSGGSAGGSEKSSDHAGAVSSVSNNVTMASSWLPGLYEAWVPVD